MLDTRHLADSVPARPDTAAISLAEAELLQLADHWAGGLAALCTDGAEKAAWQAAARNAGLPLADVSADGDEFAERLAAARSAEHRRDLGQFFTPASIVDAMLDRVADRQPDRIVDPGCGTGRFAVAAARRFPEVPVLALDLDPVSTLVCRSRGRKLALNNLEVHRGDFLLDGLPPFSGRTLFIGNPPYIRHHRLSPEAKQWGAETARQLGVPFSKLAGSHVLFLLATAQYMREGDVGCYITSAEWLDVGYGKTLRRLLVDRLRLASLDLLDCSETAFADAMTTATILVFACGGSRTQATFRQLRTLAGSAEGRSVEVAHADLPARWSNVFTGRTEPEAGSIVLGDLFRVKRGLATGANRFFVMDREEAQRRGLAFCMKSVVTSAQEVVASQGELAEVTPSVLIALPADLDCLPLSQREAARTFLREGERLGVARRYLCQHRSPWWNLGRLVPPPIVATYMMRQPPVFTVNRSQAIPLNIAHGLYPQNDLSERQLAAMVALLNELSPAFSGQGRRYQGGLEKFEPGEMASLPLAKERLESLGLIH